jgi:hypothetical protein
MIRSPDELGYIEAGHVWAGGTVEIAGADEPAPGATGTIRIFPFFPEVWKVVGIGSQVEMCEGPILIGKRIVTRVVPAAMPAGSA